MIIDSIFNGSHESLVGHFEANFCGDVLQEVSEQQVQSAVK